IRVRDVRLADPPERAVPIHLREHADLHPPISGDAIDPGEISDHRKFSRKRITKTVEKTQQRLGADDLLEASNQRCEEQSRHTAMQAVRHPTVVALAKLVTEVRVGDRKA